MSKPPKPVDYHPEIGDVLIGKYAKLDGTAKSRVFVGYADDWDSLYDSVVTVDDEGEEYESQLKNLKYVPKRYILL